MGDIYVFEVYGKQVTVDLEDKPLTDAHTWHLGPKGYIRTNARGSSGLKGAPYLHRFIVDAPKGLQVDHINHNIYDNRKANLRVCTNTENARNCRKKTPSKTGYKGVYSQHGHRPHAMIRVNSKLIYLGKFNTPLEAAQAYNAAAIKHFGKFACLNEFKEPVEEPRVQPL